MSGKLHLIRCKFFFIHSYSVFIIMFSLKKIRFQLIVRFAHLDYDVRM